MREKSRTHLRDFQARLSERLRRASASDVAARLGLMIGDQRYLVDLSDAGEIVAIPEAITPVPLTRDWFRGLVNMRGVLYAVSDLARFQGEAPTPISKESRLLAVAGRFNYNAAILVTRMLGLHSVSTMKEQARGHGETPWKLRELADTEGRVWTELSLAQLVADDRFLTVNR